MKDKIGVTLGDLGCCCTEQFRAMFLTVFYTLVLHVLKETQTNVRPFSMKDKIGVTLGDLGCCCTEQFRAMFLTVFYTLVLQVNPIHVGILMLVTKIYKIGVTLGDLGCCCTEQFRAMFLTVFYTLVLQVNPIHVGILMLVTKISDAINDPIIGALVDMRRSQKGGKFIPWIRAFSFPMAVLCVLGFVNVSNLDYGFRIGYMFVTYVLYEALYTCVNVPFGSLSSVMTDDVKERTALSRYRSLGGTIFMTVIVMIGPLVLYENNQPIPGRFLMMASVCALVGLLCLQVTCVWCKERVVLPEPEKKEKLHYFEIIKHVAKNSAFLGVVLFSFLGMVGASIVNGLNTYLFRDWFGDVQIMAVSGALNTLYAVIVFAFTQPLANKFGKKEWCVAGAGGAALVFAVLFFFPIHNPMLFIIINYHVTAVLEELFS